VKAPFIKPHPLEDAGDGFRAPVNRDLRNRI
jgi:hypothetical protein